MSIKSLMRGRTNNAPYKDKALILTTTPVKVTSTVGGTLAGTIASGVKYVDAVGVTGNAAWIIILPALAAGETIYLRNISTFVFELETTASATVFFNGNEADHSVEFADNVFATAIGIDATNVHLEFATYPQGN